MDGSSTAAFFLEFLVLRGTKEGRRKVFLDPQPLPIPPGPLWLGRNTAPGTDAALDFNDDPDVSRRHLVIERRGPQIAIRDAQSKCGTWVIGGPGQEHPQPLHGEMLLDPGATVRLMLGRDGPICRVATGWAYPFSSYLLTGRLGAGGMGEVFVARDSQLSRNVVLKTIRQSLFETAPDAEELFLREAGITASLAHANVVRVYAAARHERVLYLAMEHLPGVTLASLAQQARAQGLRLPPLVAAALIRQAALGLHAAHELCDEATGTSLGVVHRDVSPNNLMFTPQGEVKVIDFGVARARGTLAQSVPGSARVVGNPPYMSPEQVRDPATVDRRADIFSAATVLYELSSGKRLFYRENNIHATLTAVCFEPVPSITTCCPEVPPALARLIHQCLERDRAQRPASALGMAEAIRRVLQEQDEELLDPAALTLRIRELGLNVAWGGDPQAPGLELRPLPLAGPPAILTRGGEPNLASWCPTPASSPSRPISAPLTPRQASASATPPVALAPEVPPSEEAVPRSASGPRTWRTPPLLPESVVGTWTVELATDLVEQRFHLLPDRDLRVRTLTLEGHDREPQPLPLPGVRDDTFELLLQSLGRQLRVTVTSRPPGMRIHLYRGKAHVDMRQPSYLFDLHAQDQTFFVGHRTQQVRAIHYSSARRDGDHLAVSIALDGGRLELVAPGGCERLVVLYPGATLAPGTVDVVAVIQRG